ncbi:MAG: DNRLRE domain-containing protein [Myxococcales bacterium]|nr:DNRLRE domain-containing protein [Myxococcales bacterium]
MPRGRTGNRSKSLGLHAPGARVLRGGGVLGCALAACALAACALPAASRIERTTTTSGSSSGAAGGTGGSAGAGGAVATGGGGAGGGGEGGKDPCPNSAQVIFDAVEDTTLDSGSPTAPNGSSLSLPVADAVGQIERSLVRFDLDTLPASATVCLAGLVLKVVTCPLGDVPLRVHTVTTPWTEADATWTEAGLGTPWTGGDFLPGPSASFTVLVNECAPNAEIGLVVTTDVAAMHAGAVPNHGWLLKDAVESAGGQFLSLGSREGASSARPQLNVIYSLP